MSNYVKIYENEEKRIDEPFDEYLNHKYYCIIDKQLLGMYIGREILDRNPNFKLEDDYKEISSKINSEIINDIKNEIFKFVEEYINDNI